MRGPVAMYPVSCNESFYVAAPAEGCTVGPRPVDLHVPARLVPGAAHHVGRHRVQPMALAEPVVRHRRRTGLCALIHVLCMHVLNAVVQNV